MRNDYSIVLTTVALENDAEVLAEKLLKSKLAACVQIQKIKSFYTWNGKIERSDEYWSCPRLGDMVRFCGRTRNL